jgi:hypothetical protein
VSVKLVPRAGFADRPAAMRGDWLAFLRMIEDAYYREFKRYLKQELGVQALLIGSTAGSSTPGIQSVLDVIADRACCDPLRWNGSPRNGEGRGWDVANASQVAAAVPGGPLRLPAMRRVAGKPFSLSACDLTVSGEFAGEAPLFLATHAALQDWDAVYLNACAHVAQWTNAVLNGFDCEPYATQFANLTVAAAIFRRGDVAPLPEAAAVALPPDAELRVLDEHGTADNLVHGGHLGLDGDAILQRRLQVVVGAGALALNPVAVPPSASAPAAAAAGRVTCDSAVPGGDVLVVDTPRTKSVFGYFAQRALNLGPVTLAAGANPSGVCCISLTLFDGDSFAAPRRALLVATGRVAHPGLAGRQGAARGVSFGTETSWSSNTWDTGSMRSASVSGRVSVPTAGKLVRVHALDPAGQRAHNVAVDPGVAGTAGFNIGPPWQTLWYEVVWE